MSSSHLSRRVGSPTSSFIDDDELSITSHASQIYVSSVPLGNSDYTKEGLLATTTDNNNAGAASGEFSVTLVSALLLFAHFGITLYKVETDHPETSIGKQHLKDRWGLINVCIFVFALASYLYRQALGNLKIKFAPVVLVPDFTTTGVVLLILTKHVYFALYLLMAGVTFLSVMVTICDMYSFCTKASSGEKKKEDEFMKYNITNSNDNNNNNNNNNYNIMMDTSTRSRTSSTNSLGTSFSNLARNMVSMTTSSAVSSSDDNASYNKTRKKATRSILKHPPQPSSKW